MVRLMCGFIRFVHQLRWKVNRNEYVSVRNGGCVLSAVFEIFDVGRIQKWEKFQYFAVWLRLQNKMDFITPLYVRNYPQKIGEPIVVSMILSFPTDLLAEPLIDFLGWIKYLAVTFTITCHPRSPPARIPLGKFSPLCIHLFLDHFHMGIG